MKNLSFNGLILAILSCTFGFNVIAAEPELTATDLPRLKPTEPADVMKTFTIRPGFHLELAVNEPEVVDPVAMSFDENGRLYVVEMIDYSEHRDEKLSRIRLLEDRDGDGHYEHSTVFAKDLTWATAVFCYQGGVFVIASPDLIWFKDTNGDGKADERRVLFTGFGKGRDRLNMQALPNSLNWGLDNRIHGASGPNGGVLSNLVRPNDTPLNINRHDFYFNPASFELFGETGGGQHGLSFDSTGRKYVTSNSRHIMSYMFDSRYTARKSLYSLPNPLVDIPADGPAAEVYRTSPDEAWRVIRTKWRVEGTVKGIVEGGGRPSGYFTGATGVTIYRGNAYPKAFQENAFIGDAGSNLVHRKRIRPDGVGVIAERAADEQKSEFIASSDNWFRPVQFANGPDGCLYVIDMYREVIEHPWSLPESIKKFIDLDSGNNRGRIYRVVPDGFKRPQKPALGKASTAELVTTLANPNGWHRDTAARLLFERQDKAAIPLLEKMLTESSSHYGRLHALYALDGQSALTEAHILKALNDKDAIVREHAIKLAEKFINPQPSIAIRDALLARVNDPSLDVRYQLAFTIGELPESSRLPALLDLAKKDADNRWFRSAVLSSLPSQLTPVLNAVTKDAVFQKSTAGQELLRELLPLVGAGNHKAELSAAMDLILQAGTPTSFAYAAALGSGLQRAHTSFAKIDPYGKLEPVFGSARQQAAQTNATEAHRVDAIQTLAYDDYTKVAIVLQNLLAPQNSNAIQLAALNSLGAFTSRDVAPAIIARWSKLPLAVRSAAAGVLLKRTERINALLDAVEAGKILPQEFSATQVKQLRNQRDVTIKPRVAKLFAQSNTAKRADVVKAFQPALNLKGDAAKGRKIYLERCLSCHRAEGQGNALGPDLVTVKTTGKEKLLTNILDPNREVPPQFLAYSIDTKDGDNFTGLVVNETPNAVTLRMAFGQETTVQRSNIAKMGSGGQSLMPEGLEAGLTPQDLANLLEFIIVAEK